MKNYEVFLGFLEEVEGTITSFENGYSEEQWKVKDEIDRQRVKILTDFAEDINPYEVEIDENFDFEYDFYDLEERCDKILIRIESFCKRYGKED